MDRNEQNNPNAFRNGIPKDSLSYKVLRLFFSPPLPPRKRSFTIKEVTGCVAPGHEGKVEEIVQQLEQDGFLIKNPSKPGYYQYNYNECPNIEIQTEFEKDVAYEYLPAFPSYDIV